METPNLTYAPLPKGLTGESALSALQSPPYQRQRLLLAIIISCELHKAAAPAGWDSSACIDLLQEAKKYNDA
jgi:hypothetical protein